MRKDIYSTYSRHTSNIYEGREYKGGRIGVGFLRGCPLILLWEKRKEEKKGTSPASNDKQHTPVKLNLVVVVCAVGPWDWKGRLMVFFFFGPAAAAAAGCRGGVHTHTQSTAQVNKSIYLLLFYCMCYVSRSSANQPAAISKAPWPAGLLLLFPALDCHRLDSAINVHTKLL
jgi:hypothetical protein